jgi:hypothetical protein
LYFFKKDFSKSLYVFFTITLTDKDHQINLKISTPETCNSIRKKNSIKEPFSSSDHKTPRQIVSDCIDVPPNNRYDIYVTAAGEGDPAPRTTKTRDTPAIAGHRNLIVHHNVQTEYARARSR